jgi:hypothetical protein
MGRVECEVDEDEVEGQPTVIVTCSQCGHQTESYGTGDSSIKRCLALMREECPEGEENYYVAEERARESGVKK